LAALAQRSFSGCNRPPCARDAAAQVVQIDDVMSPRNPSLSDMVIICSRTGQVGFRAAGPPCRLHGRRRRRHIGAKEANVVDVVVDANSSLLLLFRKRGQRPLVVFDPAVVAYSLVTLWPTPAGTGARPPPRPRAADAGCMSRTWTTAARTIQDEGYARYQASHCKPSLKSSLNCEF